MLQRNQTTYWSGSRNRSILGTGSPIYRGQESSILLSVSERPGWTGDKFSLHSSVVVLVTFLLMWWDFITTATYRRKSFFGGLRFRGFSPWQWWEAWKQAGMEAHGNWELTLSMWDAHTCACACTHVCTHTGLRDWEWHPLLKSESPPAVTHFLQQGYTP